jgi:sigma-E factor negative regulatory protein RseB
LNLLLARAQGRACRVLAAASAPPASSPLAGDPETPADATRWLARMQHAASSRNYQGTLVISVGSQVSSSRIAHYGTGEHQFERIDMLDGQMRRVFRHDDLMQTVWPASKVVVIERRASLNAFPALLRDKSAQRLLEHYEWRAEGPDRVAGNDAERFVLQPRDAYRFGQRLWSDKHSGLLLRADVLAPDGRVLESAAFSEVTIDVRPQPDSVLRPMKNLEGYRVMRRPELTRTELDAEGWTLKPVAGFTEINCVKRSTEGERAGASGVEMLQSVLTDGLTHVSVFVEPYRAEHHRPVQTSIGATHTLMEQRDGWWVTVVGDVPMDTLKQFAQALSRTR